MALVVVAAIAVEAAAALPLLPGLVFLTAAEAAALPLLAARLDLRLLLLLLLRCTVEVLFPNLGALFLPLFARLLPRFGAIALLALVLPSAMVLCQRGRSRRGRQQN